MNTYEAWVEGLVGRRVTVKAENEKIAEIKAMSKFHALVGAGCNFEIFNLEKIDDDES